MASAPSTARVEKPSFAKIAAAGIKPPSVQQKPSNNSGSLPKRALPSSPRDGAPFVTPSNEYSQPASFTQPKKLAQLVARSYKEPSTSENSGPEVLVHAVDGKFQQDKPAQPHDGLLAPTPCDESGTQVSSSSGSIKLPSLGGKSIASGTTFALDEKESLRPDDSASVKAVDDEDVFSPPSSGLPGSHIGSEEGVRAFCDQLREISSMDSNRHSLVPRDFGPAPVPPQGVLYVPPQGPGVGMVPQTARMSADADASVDMPPDAKLLEALDSPRDRIWVLKLEQDIYDFVKDPKEAALNLPQCNAYHRMLAHKIADYYILGHVVDESGDGVRLYKTPNCRIPPPLTGITTPSTAASTPPPVAPQMKILRRGLGSGPAIANGSNIPSKTTSENGESSNDDDKKRPPASREEREARYEAARLRIMGSARPVESSEMPHEVDESRSSSAAGKKSRKKQRADSDDDFEARSAYSAYYTPPYNGNGVNLPRAPLGPQTPTTANGNQTTQVAYQQYPQQAPAPAQWFDQGHGPSSYGQTWMQNQHPGYDLSDDFRRTMSFQAPARSPSMQPPHPQPYNQQYYGSQYAWPQQNLQPSSQPQQPRYGYPQGLHTQSQPPVLQIKTGNPYPYGQLPSQTFPGRPPSKLEHPLPGSYKSKHFNPQSQAFVPGQQNGAPLPPVAPQGPQTHPGYAAPHGVPYQLQRRPSAQSQNAPFGSPQHVSAHPTPPQPPTQPMMHPLPRPVFPRQPSPCLPLPPKPGPPQQNPAAQPSMPSPANGQNASSIAKWGTPASLPAKPPPPVEPFDRARFPQIQRQHPYNTTTVSRTPNGMPSFGSMPPMAGGLAANGPEPQGGKRV